MERQRKAIGDSMVGVLASIASAFLLFWLESGGEGSSREPYLLIVGLIAALSCAFIIWWINQPEGEYWTLHHALTYIGTGWGKDNEYWDRRERVYTELADSHTSYKMLSLMCDAKRSWEFEYNNCDGAEDKIWDACCAGKLTLYGVNRANGDNIGKQSRIPVSVFTEKCALDCKKNRLTVSVDGEEHCWTNITLAKNDVKGLVSIWRRLPLGNWFFKQIKFNSFRYRVDQIKRKLITAKSRILAMNKDAYTGIKQRFDQLLKAMAHGVPASQTLAKGSATSTPETSGDSSDTQTREGKFGGISGKGGRKSPDKRP